MGFVIAAVDARLLARPILQEYDASTVELAVHPAEFAKLGTTLWKSQKRVGGKRTLAQLLAFAIATVAARLLASPILQEYDASAVELDMNPAESGKLTYS